MAAAVGERLHRVLQGLSWKGGDALLEAPNRERSKASSWSAPNAPRSDRKRLDLEWSGYFEALRASSRRQHQRQSRQTFVPDQVCLEHNIVPLWFIAGRLPGASTLDCVICWNFHSLGSSRGGRGSEGMMG